MDNFDLRKYLAEGRLYENVLSQKFRTEDKLFERRYIGSCVDVGGDDAEVCELFPDATELEYMVGNPDEGTEGMSAEISKEEWTEQIPANRIKSKHVKGKHTFHYINDYRTNFQGKMTPREASVFFIYNEDQDIHYFYMK